MGRWFEENLEALGHLLLLAQVVVSRTISTTGAPQSV
jgi:hypothetical protein